LAQVKITLSSAGMLAALNQPGIRDAVTSAAEGVANSLGGVMAHDGPVEVVVDEYQSDRPVAGVTLAHPGGIALEATYGYLTEGAAAAGLQIGRGKK
jgi:hypothetical protein